MLIEFDQDSVSLGLLSARELSNAKVVLFKYLQSQKFHTDLHALMQTSHVSPQSKLASLSPYLDQETGFIRVGGRLRHASLPHDSQHPVIL